jgi:hypothetical protein
VNSPPRAWHRRRGCPASAWTSMGRVSCRRRRSPSGGPTWGHSRPPGVHLMSSDRATLLRRGDLLHLTVHRGDGVVERHVDAGRRCRSGVVGCRVRVRNHDAWPGARFSSQLIRIRFPAAKIASHAARSSASVGAPSAAVSSRGSRRSTTSRARLLIDAGGLCGFERAWSFCAICNRNARQINCSGSGKPNALSDVGRNA